MKKERKNKGITLIALIITIIVMLILVGVTVNVALNGGLFDAAKLAASGMNMAQIKEKAEIAKAVLIADAQTDSGITADAPTYRDRLLEEFNAKETDRYNIIEVNDKYAIIIKNSELDIEVVEKTNIPAKYLLISLECETSNIEENEKIYGKNVAINITRLMDAIEYKELRKKQNSQIQVPEETKKQVFLQYFNEAFWPGPGEPFSSVDEVVIYDINEFYGENYTTIEECLENESVQEEMGKTKGQLYYAICAYYMYEKDSIEDVGANELTEQELIDFGYHFFTYDKEYYEYTNRDLELYVAIDGEEQETPIGKIQFAIDANQKTVNYSIEENGTYEFILKTKNGEEMAREALRVNDIVTD